MRKAGCPDGLLRLRRVLSLYVVWPWSGFYSASCHPIRSTWSAVPWARLALAPPFPCGFTELGRPHPKQVPGAG